MKLSPHRTMIPLDDWKALSKLQRLKAYVVFLQRQQFSKLVLVIRDEPRYRADLETELNAAIDGVIRPLLSHGEVREVCDRDAGQLIAPSLFGFLLLRSHADRAKLREIAVKIAQRHGVDADQIPPITIDAMRQRAGS